METWRSTRAQIANQTQRHPERDLTPLRMKMREQRLAEHIERVVNEAPPLTAEQRERLAALLRPAAVDGAA